MNPQELCSTLGVLPERTYIEDRGTRLRIYVHDHVDDILLLKTVCKMLNIKALEPQEKTIVDTLQIEKYTLHGKDHQKYRTYLIKTTTYTAIIIEKSQQKQETVLSSALT